MVAEAVAAANFLLLTFCSSPPFSHLVLVRKGLSSTKDSTELRLSAFQHTI